MGANRLLPSPESYPVAFLNAIRDGRGVIFAKDLLWTLESSRKRFRLCLALLRRPSNMEHALYLPALERWSVEVAPGALIVRSTSRRKPTPAQLSAETILKEGLKD